MDVKSFANEHYLTGRQIIDVVRHEFPGYDRHLHSKVLRPTRYGIRLVEEAEKRIEDAFATTPSAPLRAEYRRRPCRVQARLSKAENAVLQHALKRSGCGTMQEFLLRMITEYLRKENNDADT